MESDKVHAHCIASMSVIRTHKAQRGKSRRMAILSLLGWFGLQCPVDNAGVCFEMQCLIVFDQCWKMHL